MDFVRRSFDLEDRAGSDQETTRSPNRRRLTSPTFVARGRQMLDLAAVQADDDLIFGVAVPELVCPLRRPMV